MTHRTRWQGTVFLLTRLVTFLPFIFVRSASADSADSTSNDSLLRLDGTTAAPASVSFSGAACVRARPVAVDYDMGV